MTDKKDTQCQLVNVNFRGFKYCLNCLDDSTIKILSNKCLPDLVIQRPYVFHVEGEESEIPPVNRKKAVTHTGGPGKK